MHLIDALASGVSGAALGSATLLVRGTSTPATYYSDFEATQQLSGAVALDSFGGAIAYVNQLVDVQVRDSNGLLVREFVAGAEAPAVEVISQSFTGTSYADGSSGTSKPTTLQVVLDAWNASAGAADWNVLVGGSATTLKTAVAGLSGLFFNVKSYGAIGDGVADDGAAIQAAMNAAAVSAITVGATGGVVFLPPRNKHTTTPLSLPVGVSLLGSGATSTRLRVDNAAAASLITANGTDTGVREITGIWFGALSNFTAPLIQMNSGGPRVAFTACAFGGDTFTKGQMVNVSSATNVSTQTTTLTRCQIYIGANVVGLVHSGSGRMIVDNCDIQVQFFGAYSTCTISAIGGLFVRDSNFSMPGPTSGSSQYILFSQTGVASNIYAGSVFIGNSFYASATNTITVFQNGAASPQYDCFEVGNMFGNIGASVLTGSIIPYGYATDGFPGGATLSRQGPYYHGSRSGSEESFSVGTSGTQALNPKALGMARITFTGSASTITLTGNKGSVGDVWYLEVCNNGSGTCTLSFDANFAPDSGAALTVGNPGTILITFVCSQKFDASGVVWRQTGKLTPTA